MVSDTGTNGEDWEFDGICDSDAVAGAVSSASSSLLKRSSVAAGRDAAEEGELICADWGSVKNPPIGDESDEHRVAPAAAGFSIQSVRTK